MTMTVSSVTEEQKKVRQVRSVAQKEAPSSRINSTPPGGGGENTQKHEEGTG